MQIVIYYGISCLIGLGGTCLSIFVFVYLRNTLPDSLLLQGLYSLVAILYFCGSIWLTIVVSYDFISTTKGMREAFMGVWLFLELTGIAYVYYDRFRKGQLK